MFLFSLSSLLLSILTDRVTEIKVRESFEKQLGISNERANVMLLTAVHCLPGGMDENKRNCMVCFSSLMDRDEVLQKEIALKSCSGYSVVLRYTRYLLSYLP
jgi:hypothetical protein